MGRPFPCFCSCGECPDESFPWYYRCCDWIAGPAALKSHLDGMIFNFGVITPTATTDTWRVGNPGSTIVSTARKYGSSVLTTGFSQSFTDNCDALINSNTVITDTGTLTYTIDNVRICFGIIYTTAARQSCRRSYRITVSFRITMTDFTLSDPGHNLTFHSVDPQFYAPRECITSENARNFGAPTTFSNLQYFTPRANYCDELLPEFTPKPLEDTTRSGNAFVYHPVWTASSGFNTLRLRIQASGVPVSWATDTGSIPMFSNIPHVTYLPIPNLEGNCLVKRSLLPPYGPCPSGGVEPPIDTP